MKHAVLTAVAILFVVLPNAVNAETYPPNVQKTFLSGCKSGYAKALKQKGIASKATNAGALCSCVLTKVSAQMTLADFKEVNKGLMEKKAGKPLDPATQEKVDAYVKISTTAAGQCIKEVKL